MEKINIFQIESQGQRHYRKDRLPRAYFCYRQLAKLRLYRAFVCITRYFGWSAATPALQCFPDCGVWVSVDFDLKYKILWGETRAQEKQSSKPEST